MDTGHIDLNVETLILGLNTVSLAMGEALNRLNYHHNYLILGNLYEPANEEEKYLVETLPVIVCRDIQLIGGTLRAECKDKLYTIKIHGIKVVTDKRYLPYFNVSYRDLENVNSYLINVNNDLMFAPNIYFNVEAPYSVNRKTGLLMGALLTRYIQGERVEEATIKYSKLPVYPKRLVSNGMGILWYRNDIGATHLIINNSYTFKASPGYGLIVYRYLDIGKYGYIDLIKK